MSLQSNRLDIILIQGETVEGFLREKRGSFKNISLAKEFGIIWKKVRLKTEEYDDDMEGFFTR